MQNPTCQIFCHGFSLANVSFSLANVSFSLANVSFSPAFVADKTLRALIAKAL